MTPLASNPAPSERTRWRRWLLITIAVLAAYGGTLQVPFLYDDKLAIPDNPTIRKLSAVGDVLLPQAERGLTTSGRPVLNLSLAINYAISGSRAWSYHVFNILFHAISACLLFQVIAGTMARQRRAAAARTWAPPINDDRVALLIALVWALHPLLTQAVTYTVQRAESLMALFYLLTLYAFVRFAGAQQDSGSTHSGSGAWRTVSVVACALGMATKEVMATAPLMILLYDRTFISGSFSQAWRTRRGFYLALTSTWLVLAALVVSTGGNRGGTVGLGTGVPLWAYPLTQFQALTKYIWRAVWPHPLVFEYGTFWVQRASDVLPYAAIIVALLVASAIGLRRSPAAGFLGAWFFVILAPTSLAPGTIQMIVEHRAYLPLAAVITLVIAAIHHALGRRSLAPGIALAAALTVLTVLRNHDYRSALALWTDTVAKRPENPRAHGGLAEALEEAGRFDEALAHRRQAVRLLPTEAKYHANLAIALARAGQNDAAIRENRLALQLAPTEARTHNNLAILLGAAGDDAGALHHYSEAVRLEPGDALYHYNRGIVQLRRGALDDAIASFRSALRLRHDNTDAHYNLAGALARAGQPAEAAAHYAEAVRLQPDDADVRVGFGNLLLQLQRPNDAAAEFARALLSRPNDTDALFGEANALAALRQLPEAASRYEHLLRQAPNHAGVRFKLGNVLLDLDRVTDAVTQYTKAIELAPHDAEAQHNLGVAYARLERWPEARTQFEAALRLRPDYPDARRHLDQLKQLLGR
jgi:Flp pilus assembly protein TadD